MWFRTQDRDDPRHRITKTGFRVDPDLLGRSLARPYRRLSAMFIDLAVIGLVVLSRMISFRVFALIAAWLLWRVADPEADVRLSSATLRKAFRGSALLLGGTAAVVLIVALFTDGGESETSRPQAAGIAAVTTAQDSPRSEADGGERSAGSKPASRTAVQRLRQAGSEEALRTRASGLALELYREGVPRDRVSRDLEDLLDEAAEADPGWDASPEEVTAHALTRLDSTLRRQRAERDSLLTALADAADSADPDRLAALAARLLGTPPPPETRQLEARVEHLESELDEAREQPEQPSLVGTLRGLLNDLGLGLGWLGIYFTASLSLWGGRTPGKWLLGIRVVRIDGEPLTTWDAFSRFGGYAASVLTGLIGFAQLLWDPNRQALHDRIAGTVVVQERPTRQTE